MALFCDASCLIKFTRKQGAHIIRYAPAYYDLSGQVEFITSCAFPEFFDQADSIFVSSIARSNCFTWSFVSNHEQYSVVLISHHILGDAFLKFLQDSRDFLKNKNPIEIFDQIWNYVTSWAYNPNTSILTIITPAFDLKLLPYGLNLKSVSSLNISELQNYKGIFNVKLDNSIVFYSEFDPSIWLGSSNDIDYLKIWHALLTNKGILVISDHPSTVSNVVFSIISLIAPFFYCEEYLAFTRLGDPRFAEIIEGSTRWKIVGTTNILAAERCKQFSIIINLSKQKSLISNHPSIAQSSNQFLSNPFLRPASSISAFFNRQFSKTSNNEQKILKRLTIKLMQKLEDAFNDILSINPYGDLLQIPLNKTDISPYFHLHTSVTFDTNPSLEKSKNKNDSNNSIEDNDNDSENSDEEDINPYNDNDAANENNPNIPRRRINKQLSISEVLEFSKTETFRTWRSNISCRSAFRDAMLSEPPEDVINWCDANDLKNLINIIPYIRVKYERDAHICAVIHRHEKLAHKRLKSLAKSETENFDNSKKTKK